MSTILGIDGLPRDSDGILVGQYHVRSRSSGGWIEEVGDRAVGGAELARLDAAFGSYITIAPADADTAEACARHIYETTGDGARAKALRTLRRKPRRSRGKKGSPKSPKGSA